MLYKLYRRMKRKNIEPKSTPVTDIETPEVKIPVGGILTDGTIYEKKVYPDGKEELLYKEIRIDGNQEKKETDKENNS